MNELAPTKDPNAIKDPNSNLKSKGPMKAMVDNLREKARGSGFFDVSQNSFRPRQSMLFETKNSFGKLQNE
ncbi:hypothetical protein Hanom_Chr12g01165631 [Helianthus anomalus]